MLRTTIGTAIGVALATLLAAGCQTPASLEINPEEVVLDGAGTTAKIQVKVLDEEGNPIEEGVDVVFFSTDTEHFKLNTTNGEVTAQASGEGFVEIEVVGTEIKVDVPVRVKIASSLNVSHPQKRLRLWTGQVKEDVWSEVYSEKGATIIGFKPDWKTEDPSVVTVEPINPERRQSWVKLVGMKSGKTNIFTCFRGICETIVINVYDEDEEVDLAGNRIAKEAKEKAEKAKKKKEKNTKKIKF
jgi:hypothetical protein